MSRRAVVLLVALAGDSSTSGIDTQPDETAMDSGAAYVFAH